MLKNLKFGIKIWYNVRMEIKIYTFSSYDALIKGVANEIKQRGQCIDDENVVLTEEKNSLITERAIVSQTGGTFNTHVYSMRKFLKDFSSSEVVLSKEGSVMLIGKIISENAGLLTCFRKTKLKSLAPSVFEMISQLKSAKVTPNELLLATENSTGILKNKLADLSLIYQNYEKALLECGYKDQYNHLSSLPAVIESGVLKNVDVIFAGFSSFTRQQAEVIKSIIKNAKSVTAFFVTGDNEYLYTSEAFNLFKKLATLSDAKITEVNQQETGVSNHLKNTLFSPDKFTPFETNDIILRECADKESEIRQIAQTIKLGVINGEKYSDNQVATTGADVKVIKRIFSEYEIPCFIDEKYALASHPLAKLVLSYLSVFARRFEKTLMLDFVKNPILCLDMSFTDEYENYVLAYGIDRGEFLKPFKFINEKQQKFEEFRDNVANLFKPLKKRASAQSYVLAIKNLFEKINAEENTRLFGEKLSEIDALNQSDYGKQVYSKINASLDEIQRVLGSTEIEITEFASILQSGFIANEISIVPQRQDAVFVGGYKEIRLAKTKNLFFTGLDSSVPSAKSDVAMLTDKDIERLENLKIIIEPKIRTVNKRERESLGLALGSFTDKLYLSYSLLGMDGKPQLKSEVFEYVERNFTKKGTKLHFGENKTILLKDNYLTERQSEKLFATQVGEYLEGKSQHILGASSCYDAFSKESKSRADDILRLANRTVTTRLETNKDVTLQNKKLSATVLEGYFACPYKNFLDNALNVSERKTGKMKPTEIGNFIHEVFERYVKKIDSIQTPEQGDEAVEKIVSDLLLKEEYKFFTEKGSERNLTQRIKREVINFCRRIYAQYKNSQFKPKGQEVSFGNNSKEYQAIVLDCKDKKRYIEGKVDRVDEFGDYVRIIDYKTGSADFSDEMLFVGRKLQLLLYMNAFIKDKKPAGIYYCMANDAFIGDGRKPDFKGKTLFDKEVLFATDNTLGEENKKSSIAPINLVKDDINGGLTYSDNGTFTQEDFEKYLDYSLKIACSGAENMADGVIIASPYQGVCQYCNYGGMCEFYADAKSVERKARNVSKQTIKQATEKKEEK